MYKQINGKKECNNSIHNKPWKERLKKKKWGKLIKSACLFLYTSCLFTVHTLLLPHITPLPHPGHAACSWAEGIKLLPLGFATKHTDALRGGLKGDWWHGVSLLVSHLVSWWASSHIYATDLLYFVSTKLLFFIFIFIFCQLLYVCMYLCIHIIYTRPNNKYVRLYMNSIYI